MSPAGHQAASQPFILGSKANPCQHGKNTLVFFKLLQQIFCLLPRLPQYRAIHPGSQEFISPVGHQAQPGQADKLLEPVTHQGH